MYVVGARWAVDPATGVVRGNWGVVVENGVIEDSGDIDALISRYPSYEKILKGRGILVPAFTNAHTHLAMTMLRGVSAQLDFSRWFSEAVRPRESLLTPHDVYVGAKMGAVELALNATSCFVDMYFHEEEVIRAGLEVGLKGVYTYGVVDNGIEDKAKSEVLETKKFLRFAQAQDSHWVKTGLAPHSPYTVSPRLLAELGEIAAEESLPIFTHVAERPDEKKIVRKMFGAKVGAYDKYLERVGILKGLTAFHGTHLTRDEVRGFRKRGVMLVVNPVSNMRLGNGLPPLNMLRMEGIDLAIGTDGSASNDELSLLHDIKLGALISMVQPGDRLSPTELLHSAVRAQSRYFGKEVGLSKGCVADLAIFEERLGPGAADNPANWLVYSPSNFVCSQLFVGGTRVVVDGRMPHIDIEGVKEEYEKSLQRIEDRLSEHR
jgi:5-methylthioadenosine/S-adenosylhomocysteine deaminase